MEDKQALDFNEIDGQLELVIKHLEKKEKKKAVHYYFNESSIERIKSCAQRFHMKEGQFVEEVIVKLMDILEAPERVSQEGRKITESLKRQVTPWGRLAEQIEKTKNVDQGCDRDKANDNNLAQSVEQAANAERPAGIELAAEAEPAAETEPATKAKPIAEAESAAETEPIEAERKTDQKTDQEELARLQKALTDYIFYNFKPDYRILYQRFEKQVRDNLNICPDVLAKLIVRLSKSGEITFYSHQNLLDINKKIFEDRIPEERDDVDLFADFT